MRQSAIYYTYLEYSGFILNELMDEHQRSSAVLVREDLKENRPSISLLSIYYSCYARL